MLILTDGEPSDVDAHDERLLIEDARQAVKELDQQGIFTYCISLDPKADEYVGDIFGRQYTVIDHVERLPERLPPHGAVHRSAPVHYNQASAGLQRIVRKPEPKEENEGDTPPKTSA
jgi:hypothetical protein